MAINYPGPYEIDYEIIVSGLTHHMRYNCIVVGSPLIGTPLASINIQRKDGATMPANTAVENFWAFLRLAFHTGVTVSSVTLYRYPTPGSLVKQFVSAYAGALAAGASAVAPVLASQMTLSFRSGNGGIAKVTMLEVSQPSNTRAALVPSGIGNAYQQIANYLLSAGGWIIARDDAYPVGAIYLTGGQNEAVYKERYR